MFLPKSPNPWIYWEQFCKRLSSGVLSLVFHIHDGTGREQSAGPTRYSSLRLHLDSMPWAQQFRHFQYGIFPIIPLLFYIQMVIGEKAYFHVFKCLPLHSVFHSLCAFQSNKVVRFLEKIKITPAFPLFFVQGWRGKIFSNALY